MKSIEEFLGMRNLERGPCYKSPKKEIISHAFKHLIYNIKSYNKDKI